MMNSLEYLVKATTKHPKTTILIALLITFLALIPVSNFAIDSNVESMFESDDPDMKMMEDIDERFGEQELVTVVIDCSNSNPSTAESYVETLVEKLKKDKRFKNIQYKEDFSFAGEKGILYLPEEYLLMLTDPNITLDMVNDYRRSLYENPNYIVSENGKIYLINMGINIVIGDMEDRESLFDDLGDLIEETKEENNDYKDLILGFTGGMMVIDYEGDKLAFGDFFLTVGITIVLILLLLLVSFKSLSIPLLSVIPLIISIIWTSGVTFLIYDSLNMLSICFAALILGLGVDFSIHLLTRFMDEMDEHNEITLAFRHTFIHTGKAVILGCLTTAAAFFSLYFADTEILHQMGVIAGIGLILTMLAVFTLLPAIVTLKLKSVKRKMAGFKILGKIGVTIQRFAPVILILMIIFSIGFAVKARDARLNNDIYDMMPTEIETYRQLEKVKENFDYNQDFLVCIVDSEEELVRCVNEFRSMSEVIKAESILDYLPSDQDKKLDIIKQAIEIHPEFNVSWINVDPIEWSDLPFYRAWVSEDGKFLIKITPSEDIYDEEYQENLVSDLRKINADVTGQAVMWTKLIENVANDIIHVSLLAIIIIFGIVYIGFKRFNPICAILSLVPVSFGILGLLGTYQFFKADLNFFTIGMIPIIIGIGIDDGIHIIHRYLEEGKNSIPCVIQLTGKAIFLTTATTVLAFSSFLFSSHPTMRFLGKIPIIGLCICFFGAVIFLPALLRIIVDRSENHVKNR